jgi:GAF domain-containing protein
MVIAGGEPRCSFSASLNIKASCGQVAAARRRFRRGRDAVEQDVQILEPRESRRLVDALGRLARITGERHDRPELAAAALEAFALALAPRSVAIYVAEDARLELACDRGLAAGPAAARLALDGPTLVAHAARSRELQAIADVAAPPPELAAAVDPALVGDALSLLAIPLCASDELAGVVQAGFAAAPELAPRELMAIRALAALAGLALHDARARRARERLQSQVELILRAGLAITDTLAILPEPHLQAAIQRGFRNWPLSKDRRIPEMLRAILQSIVDHARLTVGAELGALGIGDDPNRPFEPWVFSGSPPEAERLVGRHPRPVATLGVVARGGEVVRVPDVTKHPAFGGLPPGHPPLTAMLGVPIRYRGLNLGNLYLCNKIGAPEEIPRLFERYYQSARAHERKSGLGLGLYITKGLVEAHHGRITVASEPGEGSTFRVWLPAAE